MCKNMIKTTAIPNVHGIGRRKKATARVWLKRGGGSIIVNGRKYDEYFPTKVTQKAVNLPLRVVGLEKDLDINVNICGGGVNGQADAVKLGISRALLAFDERFKNSLRKYGLLTVDSRVKERKKYGQRGARRKFQFVKR